MESDAFAVGQSISIESYYKNHLPSQVLGWEKGAFLLTRAIYLNGKPAKLKAKDACKVRFLKEGVAYGFASEIITVQFFPFPLMFIQYPAEIECLKIRVAQRFKTDLPAVLTTLSGSVVLDATVVDISEGGCGLRAIVADGVDLPPDAEYLVKLSILDQELSFVCGVRKLDRSDERCFLGMEFTKAAQPDRDALAKFLDLLKRHANA